MFNDVDLHISFGDLREASLFNKSLSRKAKEL